MDEHDWTYFDHQQGFLFVGEVQLRFTSHSIRIVEASPFVNCTIVLVQTYPTISGLAFNKDEGFVTAFVSLL